MGDRLDPGNGHLRSVHLRLSLDTAFPAQPLPSSCQARHPAHLGKGNEEKLVVCVLEPVQRVLRAVLPNPLLIGLAVQRAGSCCERSHCMLFLLRPPPPGDQPLPPDPVLYHPFYLPAWAYRSQNSATPSRQSSLLSQGRWQLLWFVFPPKTPV